MAGDFDVFITGLINLISYKRADLAIIPVPVSAPFFPPTEAALWSTTMGSHVLWPLVGLC